MIADYRGRVDRLFATAIHADLRRAALPAKRVAFINFSAALVARMAHVVRVTRLKLQQLQLPVQMGSQVRQKILKWITRYFLGFSRIACSRLLICNSDLSALL